MSEHAERLARGLAVAVGVVYTQLHEPVDVPPSPGELEDARWAVAHAYSFVTGEAA